MKAWEQITQLNEEKKELIEILKIICITNCLGYIEDSSICKDCLLGNAFRKNSISSFSSLTPSN